MDDPALRGGVAESGEIGDGRTDENKERDKGIGMDRERNVVSNWFSGELLQETHQEIKIANVNFLYDDIVHALENTIVSCINYIRRRSFSATQVYQIQWNNTT